MAVPVTSGRIREAQHHSGAVPPQVPDWIVASAGVKRIQREFKFKDCRAMNCRRRTR